MTVIFRQRTFSKRYKIQKDWDVGANHTTATIVEDKECHCLKSDNKIAECVLSPSDLEWIKEDKMIFINDDLFNKRIFYGLCKGCEYYKEKMVEKFYSVETESNGYADNTFTGTIGECEDYIRNQNLLDSKNIGEVRVALLTVQNDGETHCEELYKCEKAYRVDENQNAVSCIVYRKMIR